MHLFYQYFIYSGRTITLNNINNQYPHTNDAAGVDIKGGQCPRSRKTPVAIKGVQQGPPVEIRLPPLIKIVAVCTPIAFQFFYEHYRNFEVFNLEI